ncbi:MAG: hypothetical protein KDA98_02050 [Acidimicrobiales bacterium]|nr:hypothetical protein [Acidimicrobiales bacterium]
MADLGGAAALPPHVPILATAVVVGFVFEVLFELVFQIVAEIFGELVFQLLGDAIFRPLWRRFGSEQRKRFLVGLLVAVVAFGVGVGWGIYQGVDGRVPLAASIWSPVVLAVGLFVLSRRRPDPLALPPGERSRQPHEVWARDVSAVLPWRWDRTRLENFAAVNAAVAAGIATGYLAWT